MLAIVAVGYNRPDSMAHLLKSIECIECKNDRVDLVISIDRGARQKEIIDVANQFVWVHGEKKIRAFEQRQGLMSHILQCGELTKEYDAVIVLEDDLMVSPQCYNYVMKAIEVYDSDERVAGISLYAYRINEYVSRPFEPAYSNSDVYMMQVAQSWGQCWTRRMWNDFTSWPDWNRKQFEYDSAIPLNVNRWKSTSWKKNFARYIIEKNKFLVYPYMSLSTNCSCAGEHRTQSSDNYQVQLLDTSYEWKMLDFDNCVKYDAFFERIDPICKIDECSGKRICIDLYGLKKDYSNADVLVTTKSENYAVLREIMLTYRPHEINLADPQNGKGIFVYDLKNNKKRKKAKKIIIADYDISAIRWRYTLLHGLKGLYHSIIGRISR